MPAVPFSIIDPLWRQFKALIPPTPNSHPLGCHRPRVADEVVFDKLVQVLVFGAAYTKIADRTCSATTLRRRRDEWIRAGLFDRLERISLDAYDKMIGLDLHNLSIDGCIVKAPCGGEAAGKSPVDRGKLGTKRSLMVDGTGIPVGCVTAGANRHDSPLLAPTLEKLSRFGFDLPEQITVHLDAGYDSHKTRDLLDSLGCDYEISTKGTPLQTGARWVVERTNSWHTRGFRKLQICTEGGFNWLSQDSDDGGVQEWRRKIGPRRPAMRPRWCVGSGAQIGRCGPRCGLPAGRNHPAQCNESSGV